MRGGVEVTGTVTLTIDGHTIEVTGTGNRVRAEVGGLGAGRPSLRLATSGYAFARRLSRALDARALTVEITREGRTVAELGAGVRGGTLARLLGIARVRLVRGPR